MPPDPRPPLDEFAARLRAARGADRTDRDDESPASRGSMQSGLGVGLRIGIEMVVSVAVGAGIGYLIDGWADTRPLFMVVFLFLGFAAGLMNVLRIIRGLDEAVGYGRAVREKREKDQQAPGNGDPQHKSGPRAGEEER